MDKTILLLRHARPAIAELSGFLGRKDVGLKNHGHPQAAATAALLKHHRPEYCLCSPLKRCIDTISPASELQVDIDPDLCEVDFGLWEGMTFEQIRDSDPVAVERWADFDPTFSFPGGERLEHFLSRIQRVAERLTRCPGKATLAVTHSGVIRALICYFLGLHPRQYVLFHIAHGSLTTLDLFDGKGVLTGLNQRCVPEEF